MFYAKNGSKKLLIFEKWEYFENGKKRPQCKGYSPCKILSLGQKIKLPKTCEKRFHKHNKLIFEKWEDFESGQKWPQCKGYSLCKILSLGQKIKLPKNAKNVSINTLKLFYAKNGSKKQLIFEKWEHFENGQKWPQCKRPCKILSLGQKLNMPKTCEKRFYKHIQVVLCKKRLQKPANIRKRRAFWKWPNMATVQSTQFGSKNKIA